MNIKNSGQSIVEIIIAVSILVIIASGSVIGIVGSLSSGRLAKEETQASLIAVEGMEAMQSIRNQGFSALADGTYGLSDANGVWELVATPDVDPSGKFTRTITISPVNRNLNGDIVTGSGLADDETKYIQVDVTWNFTSTRPNDVQLVSYMTNWQLAVDPSIASGPTITTCNDFCLGNSQSGGICRKSTAECSQNSETYISGGDQFCTTNPNDTCCCQ